MNLNTVKRLSILMQLSYMKKFEGTMYELEKELGYTAGHPETRQIFKFLRELNILYPSAKIYGHVVYKIDIKKLCELIESQDFIKKVSYYLDYIH